VCGKVAVVKPTTVFYRLIDEKLDGQFDQRVADWRTASLSWEEIIEVIERETGETVTRETLRGWFAGRLIEARTVTVR
jgi:hypothetical protein